LDDAQLRRRHLELEAAAYHPCALGPELEQLAADAASDDLDRVSGPRGPAGGRRVRWRHLRFPRRDPIGRVGDERAKPRSLRLVAEGVQHGATLRLKLAEEPA